MCAPSCWHRSPGEFVSQGNHPVAESALIDEGQIQPSSNEVSIE
jgi:hypothetical protein